MKEKWTVMKVASRSFWAGWMSCLAAVVILRGLSVVVGLPDKPPDAPWLYILIGVGTLGVALYSYWQARHAMRVIVVNADGEVISDTDLDDSQHK